jgi:hypothetical protein
MRMIRPKLLAPQITIAENQVEDFKPVTAAVVNHPGYTSALRAIDGEVHKANTVVLAFRPSDEERARLAAGEDLYLSLLTFMQPMQAVILSVGPDDPASWYGVEVER